MFTLLSVPTHNYLLFQWLIVQMGCFHLLILDDKIEVWEFLRNQLFNRCTPFMNAELVSQQIYSVDECNTLRSDFLAQAHNVILRLVEFLICPINFEVEAVNSDLS